MSLINEALKKAQRRLHEQQAADAAGDANATPVRRRGQPLRAQTIILIGAGAAALVVVSVVATVVLLNREPEPPLPSPAPVATQSPPPAQNETPSPVIVAPVIPRPAPVETQPSAVSTPAPAGVAAPAPEPVASKTEPEPSTPAPSIEQEPFLPVAAPSASMESSAAAVPTAQIQAFVDAIRVTGIRSSGADSKVLMNDRVYRVNDIVDRTLGVKLVRVESDRLVFTDANGATYEKIF